jgi:hypothetical protein
MGIHLYVALGFAGVVSVWGACSKRMQHISAHNHERREMLFKRAIAHARAHTGHLFAQRWANYELMVTYTHSRTHTREFVLTQACAYTCTAPGVCTVGHSAPITILGDGATAQRVSRRVAGVALCGLLRGGAAEGWLKEPRVEGQTHQILRPQAAREALVCLCDALVCRHHRSHRGTTSSPLLLHQTCAQKDVWTGVSLI